jgi:hypothetical protein
LVGLAERRAGSGQGRARATATGQRHTGTGHADRLEELPSVQGHEVRRPFVASPLAPLSSSLTLV